MPLAISNSELRTFKECRRRWYLTYYLEWGISPSEQAVTGKAQLGTRIHTALEYYYRDGILPRRVIDAVYRDLRKTHDDPAELQKINGEYDLAVAMVEGYIDWLEQTGADEGITVIQAEQDVSVPSGVPEVNLRGRLDLRIVRAQDGAQRFIDHKTTDTFLNLTSTLHINEQMRFYALLDLLEAQTQGDTRPRTDGGLFNMLRRVKRTASAKPPFYERAEVHYNLEDLRSMWYRVTAVVRNIINTRHSLDMGGDHRSTVYPTPTPDCSWKCPFFQLCPMMDDSPRTWREMGEVLYVHTDPYGYYAPTVLTDLSKE